MIFRGEAVAEIGIGGIGADELINRRVGAAAASRAEPSRAEPRYRKHYFINAGKVSSAPPAGQLPLLPLQ